MLTGVLREIGLWALDRICGPVCIVCGARTRYPVVHELVDHPGETPPRRNPL
jgi:hypothetical protein